MLKKLFIHLTLFSMIVGQTVSISGTVLNKKGKDVKKVTITLNTLDGVEVASTQSAKKGVYLFENIAPAPYILWANHKKEGEAKVQLMPNEGSNSDIADLVLVLSKGEGNIAQVSFGIDANSDALNNEIALIDLENASSIKMTESEIPVTTSISFSGKVINAKGKGQKKVTLTFSDIDGKTAYSTETDKKGVFNFPNMILGQYIFEATHEKLGAFRRMFVPSNDGHNSIINFQIQLPDTSNAFYLHTFSGDGPLRQNPTLLIDHVNTNAKIGEISLDWSETTFSESFELYDGDRLIYEGSDTRFSIDAPPGERHCFKLRARDKQEFFGPFTEEICKSSIIPAPTNLRSTTLENSVTLSWAGIKSAKYYRIYRNDILLINSHDTEFTNKNLTFGENYQYQVSAVDTFKVESEKSHPVQNTIRRSIQTPLLSSLDSDEEIVIIWTDIEFASKYYVYRNEVKVSEIQTTTFKDRTVPGESFCYRIIAIDDLGTESEKSNEICGKVPVKSPENFSLTGELKYMNLSWDRSIGAENYNIYQATPGNTYKFLAQAHRTFFVVDSLDDGDSLCFTISSVDRDGVESAQGLPECASTKLPPELKITNFEFIESSENNVLNARETGKFRFTVQNIGESPAYGVKLIINADNQNLSALNMDTVFILDTLEAKAIQIVDLEISAEISVETAERHLSLIVTEKHGYDLTEQFPFSFQTVAVVPPKILLADFSVFHEHGISYIPNNEKVEVTVRLQNVGEGLTDYVKLEIIEDHQSFSLYEPKGIRELEALAPGDFTDFSFVISSRQSHFTIPIVSTDYLGIEQNHEIELRLEKKYRDPMNMSVYPIGTLTVDPYPDEMSSVDVENHIPLGKRNPNALAILLGIESYDNFTLPKVMFANRDIKFMRSYFQNTFGLDDFQIIPAKPWQMDGGPTLDEMNALFDPHKGDLRKRISTSHLYSGVDKLDIYIYYNGLGKHINGKPYLLPKDANPSREISNYSLEFLLKNLSEVSVLDRVQSITVLLDIKWVNQLESSDWEYPKLPENFSLISSSALNETSHVNQDLHHSLFTYAFLKSLHRETEEDAPRVIFSKLQKTINKLVPELSLKLEGNPVQTPYIVNTDSNHVLIEFYGVE